MIDWVTVEIPFLHTPIDTGYICKVNPGGDIDWQSPCRKSIEGSYSSSITVKSIGGNGAGQALLQVLIVPDMQGRVFAMLSALRSLMSPLGLALAGPFTDVFGMQSWMLGAGIGITMMVAAMPFIPEVADIEGKKRP